MTEEEKVAALRNDLAKLPTDDLVAIGTAIRDALYARVLDDFADDADVLEAVNGIGDDLAMLARRTSWRRI